ncbi:hypothetical protein BH160DRAFT_4815 [Burkholderia sp. H160]|nr:hypothetical protein BH160DRAFT_4815 [Burkholderia sp. H160]
MLVPALVLGGHVEPPGTGKTRHRIGNTTSDEIICRQRRELNVKVGAELVRLACRRLRRPIAKGGFQRNQRFGSRSMRKSRSRNE